MEYQVYDKFEYKTVKIYGTIHIDYELNKLGALGWELVNIDFKENIYIFKRKLECTNIINE